MEPRTPPSHSRQVARTYTPTPAAATQHARVSRRISGTGLDRLPLFDNPDSDRPEASNPSEAIAALGQLHCTTPNGRLFCPDSVHLGRDLGSCPGVSWDAVAMRLARGRIPTVSCLRIFLCKSLTFFIIHFWYMTIHHHILTSKARPKKIRTTRIHFRR
uniref:Uncharacterized protein n=1 Tax=Triticum urartu TaxID=4572 RepID=A0A8R7U7V1_TRIUA